ncbi:homodimeric dihydroxyacetone kinase [Stella humosa]|uniref:Homodimeric dihydroxyacetone kinase n=1 Tax=Stella humosa TaxID=94 RepID=A0A3N1LIS3_9PROT|nr:dihydroxyacetone kinase subunit DhaL [Stella humosa]ROP91252.1 homodimeric dihydroxyacetone kinase [Stella humosa]BBK34394.1 dihydroxyacetone kinase [Stella humosa]
MPAKKLINDPVHVVREMLEGIVATTPGLALLEGYNVVVRRDATGGGNREVALISGGGSGHEPAHAGYVGQGMLHAAVAGDVFASPSTDAVLAAIRAVTGPAGALLIIKNYTGDRLNFGLAAAIARSEGLDVDMLMVADDVAIPDDGGTAGRRGIAGTVLVNKVAGAAAAAGASLADVKAEAAAAMAALGTMGVALSPCILPGAAAPNFTLGPDEIELGLGIHGEAGVSRERMMPADRLVDILLDAVIADRGLAAGDRVALLVNDLGTTTPMELSVVARQAAARLAMRGLVLERALTGRFLSALDMAGISLSLLRLDDARLARLDAPTEATAWPRLAARRPAGAAAPRIAVPVPAADGDDGRRMADLPGLRPAISAVCDALARHEPELTALDRQVGDGDLGSSLARGAQSLRATMEATAGDDPARMASAMAAAWRRDVGGTSGPLYAVFLLEAGSRLAEAVGPPTPADWADAFLAGCAAIAGLGGAERGDRTMLDALWPAAERFQARLAEGAAPADAWAAAVEAARQGAEATRHIRARRGRSSYLGERVIGTPDPGAVAVVRWLEALAGRN